MTLAQTRRLLFQQEGSFMTRKRKPFTRALVKKHFGKHAKVHGFAGRYRITTDTGGEVVITPDKLRVIFGGEDVYRASVMLVGECWGTAKAAGTREFMLASVAHGEAWGVNVRPDFRDWKATLARWCLSILVFFVGCSMLPGDARQGPDDWAMFLVLILSVLVFFLMKRKARHEEQRKLELGGFIYPRQAQGADFANDDDLKQGGLF